MLPASTAGLISPSALLPLVLLALTGHLSTTCLHYPLCMPAVHPGITSRHLCRVHALSYLPLSLQLGGPGGLRITAKVVAIPIPGPRREQVVGVLQVSGASGADGARAAGEGGQ